MEYLVLKTRHKSLDVLWLVCLLCTLTITGTATGQNGTSVKGRDILLRPGDKVGLWVWREADSTGEYPVQENGVVVFPRIGPIKVTDLSKTELRDSLVRAFSQYLQTPSIDVRYLRRVNVLGAVREPGVFYIDETFTLADALALAGGSETHGRPDKVKLVRGSTELIGGIQRGTKLADLPLESGDQLIVPERNWFSRNTAIVATLMSGLLSLSVALAAK
jgi:protein involved in polysaccharide export with SLBB domain